MTIGILAALPHLNTLLIGGVMMYTEETQRYLFARLTRKSAQAAGIQALATVAIGEGDLQALERIAALAAELAEDLDELTNLAGQISTATTAPQ